MILVVVRAPSPSTEGYRCFTSSGSSGATCGLLRCFFTTAEHVHDLVVDYASLRAKPFEFFVVSFEHRRRVAWIVRPCAGIFGLSSSLRLAQSSPSPLLQATTGVDIFCPAVLLRLRPPWRPSLLVPPTTASGCASSLARPVLATPVRAHRPRRIPEPGKPGHVSPDGLTAPTSASLPLRLPRRIAIFVSGVFSITPPPWRLLVRPRLHVRLPRLLQPR